jgi:hypothetical protein
MSDNKIDINTPPTEQEIQDFANSLNEQDVLDVKRRRLGRKPPPRLQNVIG